MSKLPVITITTMENLEAVKNVIGDEIENNPDSWNDFNEITLDRIARNILDAIHPKVEFKEVEKV